MIADHHAALPTAGRGPTSRPRFFFARGASGASSERDETSGEKERRDHGFNTGAARTSTQPIGQIHDGVTERRPSRHVPRCSQAPLLRRGQTKEVRAVEDVSFAVRAIEIFGIGSQRIREADPNQNALHAALTVGKGRGLWLRRAPRRAEESADKTGSARRILQDVSRARTSPSSSF